MKVGNHDRPKLFAAGALMSAALMLTAHWILGPESSASAASSGGLISVPVASASSKKRAKQSDVLDPTLHIAQLALTEAEPYEGSGRNIFQFSPDKPAKKLPPAPVPRPPVRSDQALTTPILLKFIGLARIWGFPRKVCLTQGDDVFIASEGDIVDRRYKIVRVGSNTIDVEDLVKNSQFTLSQQQ